MKACIINYGAYKIVVSGPQRKNYAYKEIIFLPPYFLQIINSHSDPLE